MTSTPIARSSVDTRLRYSTVATNKPPWRTPTSRYLRTPSCPEVVQVAPNCVGYCQMRSPPKCACRWAGNSSMRSSLRRNRVPSADRPPGVASSEGVRVADYGHAREVNRDRL